MPKDPKEFDPDNPRDRFTQELRNLLRDARAVARTQKQLDTLTPAGLVRATMLSKATIHAALGAASHRPFISEYTLLSILRVIGDAGLEVERREWLERRDAAQREAEHGRRAALQNQSWGDRDWDDMDDFEVIDVPVYPKELMSVVDRPQPPREPVLTGYLNALHARRGRPTLATVAQRAQLSPNAVKLLIRRDASRARWRTVESILEALGATNEEKAFAFELWEEPDMSGSGMEMQSALARVSHISHAHEVEAWTQAAAFLLDMEPDESETGGPQGEPTAGG
nr:hypothetical protein KitaXyl93_76820 [Kitasatospora sp. Xyl93]